MKFCTEVKIVERYANFISELLLGKWKAKYLHMNNFVERVVTEKLK
jgi:hypothetical protein